MPRNKPVVVVTRKLPDAIETRMMELFDVRLNLEDAPMSASELVDAVKTADVIVPTVTDRIDAKVLSQSGLNLRLIANYGAGVDHIDLASARQRSRASASTPRRARATTASTRRRRPSKG